MYSPRSFFRRLHAVMRCMHRDMACMEAMRIMPGGLPLHKQVKERVPYAAAEYFVYHRRSDAGRLPQHSWATVLDHLTGPVRSPGKDDTVILLFVRSPLQPTDVRMRGFCRQQMIIYRTDDLHSLQFWDTYEGKGCICGRAKEEVRFLVLLT
ncbi:hypothetical protein PC41400_04470 [Paenibacillus chitinolyticus]|uniref:Uncharacterized protein n=1 Tax=Paenibacillus chitinolyticus TaxID=79263 RepID=A0A410WRP1_9BACL|nr:hypothetical protein PC41400_04470 [Paenibacillus chitinolyticus]